MEQQIRFCKTSDDVRIAYAVTGAGPPLVWVPGWLSHLELDLEFPPFRERVENLAKDFTLIRFDKRGTGVSQRGISDFSLEAHVLDIEAVVAVLKLENFALAGSSEGGPISLAYTARHLDAVSHLILMGTWATAASVGGGPEMLGAMVSIVSHEWGLGSRLLADLFFGEDADPSVQHAFALYQQQAATAGDALASLKGLMQFDVTALLPMISAPTLVLHARGDRTSPIEGGQEIAAAIPGARFVSVEGNHVPNRKQMAQMDEAIREFILGPAPARTTAPAESAAPSGLVTILFTDMVGSTDLTQRVGDDKAQETVRGHNTVVRDALKEHGGSEVKHTGDGIMASFASARLALDCAIAIQRAFTERNAADEIRDPSPTTLHPLRVRIGLNAGEPVAEERDLFGTSVQLAARVCAQADAGQILVSNVVRELTMGKGFLFADVGDVALKGFEDPVRLYEVKWED